MKTKEIRLATGVTTRREASKFGAEATVATENASLVEDDEKQETWLQRHTRGTDLLRALIIGATIGVIEVIVIIGNPLEIRKTAQWSDLTWDKWDAFKDHMRERVGLETTSDRIIREMQEDREKWIREQLQSQARVHPR